MKMSFKDLVDQMDVLQENEQGMLRGGFSSFSIDEVSPPESTNTNSVSGCACTNTNNTVGCSC